MMKIALDYNKAMNELLHGGACFDTNSYQALDHALEQQGITDNVIKYNFRAIFELGRVVGNETYIEFNKK